MYPCTTACLILVQLGEALQHRSLHHPSELQRPELGTKLCLAILIALDMDTIYGANHPPDINDGHAAVLMLTGSCESTLGVSDLKATSSHDCSIYYNAEAQLQLSCSVGASLSYGVHLFWWVYRRPSTWWSDYITGIWCNKKWLQNFRMKRATFQWIVEALHPTLQYVAI